MKIRKLTSGKYDPQGRTLTLFGRDSLGRNASVEISVESRDQIATWLLLALSEGGSPGDPAPGMKVDRADFSVAKDGSSVAFSFARQDVRISVHLPLAPPLTADGIAGLQQRLAEYAHFLSRHAAH